MKRVLVVYYSQSGQVRQAVKAFTDPLRLANDVKITDETLEPRITYPYPWRSVTAFFGVMPDTVLGLAAENCPLAAIDEPAKRFDLVILAYPVWFLMPALPVQRFLFTEGQEICRQADVITLCVCRGMWHHASRVVGERLRELGARHRDNVVVTHQGPQWATFISVPRQLLSGKRDRLMPGLPPAGIGMNDLSRLKHLGGVLRNRLGVGDGLSSGALLSGEAAVIVNEGMILPELLAWPYFQASAHAIRFASRFGTWARGAAIVLFALVLLVLITVGLPLALLLGRLLRIAFPSWFRRQAVELAEPAESLSSAKIRGWPIRDSSHNSSRSKSEG